MSDCIPCGCRDSLPTKELGIEEWKDEYLKLVIYTSTVSRENAKLRELVARVERARRDLCDAYPDAELLNCEECPAWSACRGDLMDRIRELGIEVDG